MDAALASCMYSTGVEPVTQYAYALACALHLRSHCWYVQLSLGPRDRRRHLSRPGSDVNPAAARMHTSPRGPA